jgi:hypothetical protein
MIWRPFPFEMVMVSANLRLGTTGATGSADAEDEAPNSMTSVGYNRNVTLPITIGHIVTRQTSIYQLILLVITLLYDLPVVGDS